MKTDAVFSPSFGNRPKEMVGREGVIQQLISGLKTLPGSRERASLLLGQRGVGKTVLLLEVAEQARQKGYVVASPTITSGEMLTRIVEKLQVEGEEKLGKKKAKLAGGSVGFFGFSAGLQFDTRESESKSFSYKLSKLVTAIEKKGFGTLILVDEVQANSADLKELIIAYQELVGEGKNVAMILAGLPGAISAVLNDKVLTFLNRASRIELLPLALVDIDAYYKKAFPLAQIKVDAKTRGELAGQAQGSPYLMQLIGHYLAVYSDGKKQLDQDAVSQAVELAKADFVNDVCRTSLAPLTEQDIVFLRSMAEDSGESRMSDIATRMSVSADYAQQYRRRLLDAGLISQVRRGVVEFAVPYLREYFVERAR